MSWPESPFPTDARGLLVLIALLHVGLVLFFLVWITGLWWAYVVLSGFLVGTLWWLYRRDARMKSDHRR